MPVTDDEAALHAVALGAPGHSHLGVEVGVERTVDNRPAAGREFVEVLGMRFTGRRERHRIERWGAHCGEDALEPVTGGPSIGTARKSCLPPSASPTTWPTIVGASCWVRLVIVVLRFSVEHQIHAAQWHHRAWGHEGCQCGLQGVCLNNGGSGLAHG